MLSMNGIIVCELLLGGILMSLIFTSLANTDLVADPSSKPKHEMQPDRFRTATKPGPAVTDLSPEVYDRFGGRQLGENDGVGSGPSGK
jgi:hypothetical protein